MPFEMQKLSDYESSNPIVARVTYRRIHVARSSRIVCVSAGPAPSGIRGVVIHYNFRSVQHGRNQKLFTDNDEYLDSVYGWAGVVGEAIEHDRENAVLFAVNGYHEQRASISDSDLKSIEGITPDRRAHAAEAAYKTLLGCWEEIKTLHNEVLGLIEKDGHGVLFLWSKETGWKRVA